MNVSENLRKALKGEMGVEAILPCSSRSLLSKAQHLAGKEINSSKTLWVSGFFQESGNTEVGKSDIDSGTWPRKYIRLFSLNWGICRTFTALAFGLLGS